MGDVLCRLCGKTSYGLFSHPVNDWNPTCIDCLEGLMSADVARASARKSSDHDPEPDVNLP